jgi:hypothetical protein
MELRVVQRITSAPTGPVTTEIGHATSSSSPPPNDSMTKGHRLVQPGWDNPNRGWHMTHPDDPFHGCQGPRAMVGSPANWGKGTGAAPALSSVVWLKAAVVVDLQGQLPHHGGIGLHGDRDSGDDVGQRLLAGAQ